MADSKVFRLLDEVTVEMVGDAVVSFLREQKTLLLKVQKQQRVISSRQKRRLTHGRLYREILPLLRYKCS